MNIFKDFDCVIFDFDGTICDTGEGIRRSVAYSLEKMGVEPPEPEALNCFIGPPLHDSFMKYYGFSKEKAFEALMGNAMAKTGGKANPILLAEILKNKIQ